MSRTTGKQLNALLPIIRRMTDTPEMRWTPDPKQGNACPVNAYYIEQGSKMYGYHWKLVQTCNTGGGITTVLSAPTAADLERSIRAWMRGYAQAEETARARNRPQ
jgi:hypothetical protein